MIKMKKPQYRHELKFRVCQGTYEILRRRLKAAMSPDAHAKNGIYRVTSLYFDDIFRSAYHDKVNGVLHRKKFRVRTYDLDPSHIRLEEKCRDGNVGYKKSAALSEEEYRALLAGKTDFLADERFSDTAAEDFFWTNSAARLSPAAVVDYLREPYVCPAGNVRVTFDMNVSAGNTADMFDASARYERALETNEAILEVKYDNFLPAYIEALISGLPLICESVSKYVLCSDKDCLKEREQI